MTTPLEELPRELLAESLRTAGGQWKRCVRKMKEVFIRLLGWDGVAVHALPERDRDSYENQARLCPMRPRGDCVKSDTNEG